VRRRDSCRTDRASAARSDYRSDTFALKQPHRGRRCDPAMFRARRTSRCCCSWSSGVISFRANHLHDRTTIAQRVSESPYAVRPWRSNGVCASTRTAMGRSPVRDFLAASRLSSDDRAGQELRGVLRPDAPLLSRSDRHIRSASIATLDLRARCRLWLPTRASCCDGCCLGRNLGRHQRALGCCRATSLGVRCSRRATGAA
jgi:hypothetical protein